MVDRVNMKWTIIKAFRGLKYYHHRRKNIN